MFWDDTLSERDRDTLTTVGLIGSVGAVEDSVALRVHFADACSSSTPVVPATVYSCQGNRAP